MGNACVEELVRNYSDVSEIIILSRDEIKQLEMMENYPEEGSITMKYCLGDVRDYERLTEVLKGVNLVIHAAAIKHVVMAEKNPKECFKTNVGGTQNLIKACKINDVSKVVLISTDKAVNPISAYGKSKLEAEGLFKEAHDTQTSFGIVRMGNVIGSRGSVFQAFEKQRKTGTVKVTHPKATRFCISQKKAAKFIIHALLSGESGPLIPEMETFNILDLAKEIAPGCKIEIVGLRSGDKLHEELQKTHSS